MAGTEEEVTTRQVPSPSIFKRVSNPFHGEDDEYDTIGSSKHWKKGGKYHRPGIGDSYTIGDVEERITVDHLSNTGEERKLLFALNEWPKSTMHSEMFGGSLGNLIRNRSDQSDKAGEQKSDKPDKESKDKKKEKKRPKPIRKVFVAFKVKRVSDISNLEQHFKINFHIYFNWVPTFEDYKSYREAKAKGGDALYNWEPKWYPHLEYLNQIEADCHWEHYPQEGRFRMRQLKGFFDKVCDDPMVYDPVAKSDDGSPLPIGKWNADRCYFIRAKLNIELLLSEELELQSFPFDCQDLSVVMREESKNVRIVFLPEMRKLTFASIDPRYSVITEWDMESARIEFGSSDPSKSRGGATYSQIILRLKMQRRWEVFMWNVVFMMACIEALTLTMFKMDIEKEEGGDRLGLGVIMVLTAIAFLQVVRARLPNVPYLTLLDWYVYLSFLFLIAMVLETAIVHECWLSFADFDANKVDNPFFVFCMVYLFLYHVFFAFYSWWSRREEKKKLVMSSDEIEAEVELARPVLAFDNREGKRCGDDKRLLSFQAKPKLPKKKDASKDKKGDEKKPKGDDAKKTDGPKGESK